MLDMHCSEFYNHVENRKMRLLINNRKENRHAIVSYYY